MQSEPTKKPARINLKGPPKNVATKQIGAAAMVNASERNEQQRLKRLDLKRLELLRAAVRVFNKRGASNTSLEDVATELGLTKAALYYYFESKQEILYACYQMSLDLSDHVIADAHKQGKTGFEKLEFYIRRVIELGLSELQPTIGLRQQLALEPEYLKKLVKRRRIHRDKLRAIISEGVGDGTIVNCNPAVLQSIIAGAHSWLFLSFRQDGSMSAADLANAVVQLLSGGFAMKRSE